MGMAQIPQVNCTGSNLIRYNRATGLATSALVTIPSDAVSALKYNNNLISGNPSITVQQSTYDPSWSGVYINSNILTNNFTLECPTPFHVGIIAGQGNSTGLYGYISGFDDRFQLYDPSDITATDIIYMPKQCADTVSLKFSYNSCSDSIEVISGIINQGEGQLVDIDSKDTVLGILPSEGFSGNMSITILVQDGFGGLESIEFRFEYLGEDYDPITVPNVITPNADGINDILTIKSDDILDIFKLNVYSRWGSKVFSTKDQNEAWDGRSNSSDVAPGVYYYSIQTETICGQLIKTGAIHVLK